MGRSFTKHVAVMTLGLGLGAFGAMGCDGDSDSVPATGTGGSGAGAGGTTSGSGGTTTGGGGAGAQGGTSGTGGACGDAAMMAQYETCRAADDQASCEAAGGTWTAVGPSPVTMCVCSTGQDGCQCTRSTDCVAPCIAPTSGGVMECDGVTEGECAGSAPFAGCWCWFDEDGQVTGMCID